MITNACLPANNCAALDFNTAADAGLRRNYNVLLDADVVSHMHQVVDFRAAPDHGILERSAINCHRCSNFDVIFNDESANLWELLIAPCLAIAYVAESIAAQHRAGVYADIVADAYTRIDRHVRFNETALTDSGVFTDNRARSNARMCSD